jgi:hypothetical protein
VQAKDKELAMTKFKQAMALYPDSSEAIDGLKQAEELLDKVCLEIIGKWQWSGGGSGGTSTFKEDGSVYYSGLFGIGSSSDGKWECLDASKRRFLYAAGGVSVDLTLTKDGKHLKGQALLGPMTGTRVK